MNGCLEISSSKWKYLLVTTTETRISFLFRANDTNKNCTKTNKRLEAFIKYGIARCSLQKQERQSQGFQLAILALGRLRRDSESKNEGKTGLQGEICFPKAMGPTLSEEWMGGGGRQGEGMGGGERENWDWCVK